MLTEFEKAAEYIEIEIQSHMNSISELRKSLWRNVWVMAVLAVILHFATAMAVHSMVSGLQGIISSAPDKLRVDGNTIKVVGEYVGYGHLVLVGFLMVLASTLLQTKNENSIVRDLRSKKSKIYQLSILTSNNLKDNYDASIIVQLLSSTEEPCSDISPSVSAIENGCEKISEVIKSLARPKK